MKFKILIIQRNLFKKISLNLAKIQSKFKDIFENSVGKYTNIIINGTGLCKLYNSHCHSKLI